MSETIKGVLGGMGALILVYLAVRNAGGVAQIFNATGSNTVNVVKSLQGR